MTAEARSDGELLVFLIAGEESGDRLGGPLMAALKERARVRFAGVGGARMESEGLKSLFPMTDLSVMGLAEVLPRLPLLLRRIRETAAEVRRLRPDVVVSIDAPDFSFRVAKRLRGQGIPLVHYVAPSVWAWRPGRARKVAALLDHLLTLFPFEPPYFEVEGLSCTAVGHSVVEGAFDQGDGAGFRARHGIGAGRKLLCVLPGSRRGEVARLLPVFGETVRRLRRDIPDVAVVLPVVPWVAEAVDAGVADWPVPVIRTTSETDKIGAFAASDAALAASGTVALELALAGLPFVTAYRVAPVTAMIGRRLIRTPYVNLVNILLQRMAVPELLQEDCSPDRLTAALRPLLTDGEVRRQQVEDLARASTLLGANDEPPSAKAAQAVLSVARRYAEGRPT